MPVISIENPSVKNFRSYGEALWSFGTGGLVAITGRMNRRGFGDNSSGKTSLLSAISWCFYGETLEGERDADSIIKDGTDYCRVEVPVRIDGVLWTVRRTRGRSGSKVKTGLHLYREEKDHTPGTMPLTKKKIEEMFGTYEEFTSHVAFTASRPLSIIAELPGAKAKALLSTLLGLDRYVRAEAKAKDDVNLVADSLSTARTKAERLKGELTNAKRLLRSSKESTPEPEPFDVTEAEDEIDRLKKRIDSLSIDPKAYAEADKQASEARKYQRNAELAYERAKARYAGFKSKQCPTCGQRVKKDQSGKASAEAAYRAAGSDCDKAGLAVAFAEQALAAARPDPKVNNLRTKLRDVENGLAAHRAAVALYQAAIKSAKNRRAELNENVGRVRAELAKVRAEIKTLGKKKKSRQFWAEHFPRLRSHLLDDYLAALSKRSTAHARTFFGPEATIRFTPTTENKDGTERDAIDVVVNLPGLAPHYENLSRGAKARVNLCNLLAMVDASNTSKRSWRQLFVDEVLDGMDEAGSLLAVQAVRQLSKDRQVVVVTRNPRVIAAADTVITVNHDGRQPYGTSTLEISK